MALGAAILVTLSIIDTGGRLPWDGRYHLEHLFVTCLVAIFWPICLGMLIHENWDKISTTMESITLIETKRYKMKKLLFEKDPKRGK